MIDIKVVGPNVYIQHQITLNDTRDLINALNGGELKMATPTDADRFMKAASERIKTMPLFGTVAGGRLKMIVAETLAQEQGITLYEDHVIAKPQELAVEEQPAILALGHAPSPAGYTRSLYATNYYQENEDEDVSYCDECGDECEDGEYYCDYCDEVLSEEREVEF